MDVGVVVTVVCTICCTVYITHIHRHVWRDARINPHAITLANDCNGCQRLQTIHSAKKNDGAHALELYGCWWTEMF